MTRRPGERTMLVLLLLLHTGVYAWLVLTSRLPRGHDTLSVYILQYVFLSNAVPGTGPALWLPGAGHGVISTWFADVQSGLLQNVLLLFGGVPSGTPMVPTFYAGLFLEDLILVLGMWSLSGHYFRRPLTRFFVSATALGSSLWVSNIFWNHRLVFAVPLILSLSLDFLETGQRPKLFLAFAVCCLQLLGNAVYIPFLSCLVVVLFLALHVILHRRRLRLVLPALRPRWTDLAWLGAIALVVVPVCLSLVHGLGAIRQYHPGREPDGRVPVDVFLTFPGALQPTRYLDLLVGQTPSLDFSLYCGIIAAAFVPLALLLRPGKAVLHHATVLLLVVLFSIGYLGIVAPVAYHAVPLLHFFRYVSLASPLVRLFVILLAGHAVERLLADRITDRPFIQWAGRLLLSFSVLSVIAWGFGRVGLADFTLDRLLWDTTAGLMARTRDLPNPATFAPFVAAAAGALLLLRNRGRRHATAFLIALHAIDLFAWKVQVLRQETLPLTDSELAFQRIEPLPFVTHRSPDYGSTARSRGLSRLTSSEGALYDVTDMYLHLDPPRSRDFITQWLQPFEDLHRTREGLPLGSGSTPKSLRPRGSIPDAGPLDPYRKIEGQTAGRLQVFAEAHVTGSDQQLANLIHRKDFRGDVLLISPTPGEIPETLPEDLGRRNERLDVPVEVLHFDADHLRVRVDLPDGRRGAWLYYADVWHPDWQADVNGARSEVRRANLAYKAVRLGPGRNVVELRFSSPLRSALYRIVGAASLLGLIGLAVWTASLLGAGRRPA